MIRVVTYGGDPRLITAGALQSWETAAIRQNPEVTGKSPPPTTLPQGSFVSNSYIIKTRRSGHGSESSGAGKKSRIKIGMVR